MSNTLYFGDNFHVLREHVKDESVDLVYLDPPFNSNATYNVLFRAPSGGNSRAQVQAFEDTWHWGEDAEAAYENTLGSGSSAAGILCALRSFLGENDMMAYLSMMAIRLIELHRVLKPTGSIYLHCDPTACHYLKIIMDGIFSPVNFRNDLIWRRSNSHSKLTKQYGPIHDNILFYSKSNKFTFNPKFTPYTKVYVANEFRYSDERGRFAVNNLTGPGSRSGDSGKPWMGYDPSAANRHWAIPASLRPHLPEKLVGASIHNQLSYLYDQGLIVLSRSGRPKYKQYLGAGIRYQDIWAFQPGTDGVLYGSDSPIDQDVKYLDSEDERLGYPTQKPLGLLERIINTSSNPGDTILDPFCGCGTTVHAAQKNDRHWIGIDITHVAIQIICDRLRFYFPQAHPVIVGRPEDADGARDLAARDKYQFQWWAVSLVGGQPRGERKKGADRGIDGEILFRYGAGKDGRAIISVKGGHNVGPTAVRELGYVVNRERADIGILITLNRPTRDMISDAAAAGFFGDSEDRISRIQIVSIDDLMSGGPHAVRLPPRYSISGATAEARKRGRQTMRKTPQQVRKEPELMLPFEGGTAVKSTELQLSMPIKTEESDFQPKDDINITTAISPKRRRKAV